MKTWTMEFRIDFEDEQKYAVMEQMAREAARTMLATAMFLQDGHEPTIKLYDFDPMEGKSVIDINADIVTTL